MESGSSFGATIGDYTGVPGVADIDADELPDGWELAGFGDISQTRDGDYDAIPNENPTNLISRIIEQGFTKDATEATVAYEYVTTLTYNAKGQLLTVDGPLPGTADTTQLGYDAASGNLLSITRPLIGSTSFSDNDAAGQAGRVTDVNSQEETFTYDGRGRVTGVAHEADDSSRTVLYDSAGLPNTTTDEDYVSYSYDAGTNGIGRRTGMIDPAGTTSFGYDSRGRLVNKTNTINSIDYRMSRVFTPASRLQSFAYPSGRTVDMTSHSNNGKLQTVSTTYSSAPPR